jgi:hypothetical protein
VNATATPSFSRGNTMHTLSPAEIGSQIVLELPDRELMGAVIWVNGSVDIGLLENLLNHTFRNWDISVLNNNSVHVTVEDDVTGTEITMFCNETASAMSVQCASQLT